MNRIRARLPNYICVCACVSVWQRWSEQTDILATANNNAVPSDMNGNDIQYRACRNHAAHAKVKIL